MVPARPPTPCKLTKSRLPDAEITKGRRSLHLHTSQFCLDRRSEQTCPICSSGYYGTRCFPACLQGRVYPPPSVEEGGASSLPQQTLLLVTQATKIEIQASCLTDGNHTLMRVEKARGYCVWSTLVTRSVDDHRRKKQACVTSNTSRVLSYTARYSSL